MAIHFEQSKWNEVKHNYSLWWEQKLQRSLVKITVEDAFEPQGAKPPAPLLNQQTCTDFSWSAEELIETLDWKLSQEEYLGDAYPFVNFDMFGPGVLAAFCGAKLDNSSGQVWFSPEEIKEISDIHIKYDPNNIWLKRIKDIYCAGNKKWQGKVLMGMPDLGGPIDVAAVFRTSEHLLMDLYDEPEEVKRLISEVEIAWKAAYDELNNVLQPVNPGYSDWTGLYSAEPSYVLQCDFAYMISTPMFDEFTLPSVKRSCKELVHTMYHLDGVGQLNHLDSLLKVKELQAVQWIYGDGKPSARHWPEVYEKIRKAGKSMQMVGDYDDFKVITGLGNHVYYNAAVSKADEGWKELLQEH